MAVRVGRGKVQAMQWSHDRWQLTHKASKWNRPGKRSSILLPTCSLTAQKSIHCFITHCYW